jgi:hypothetical protein
MSSPDFGSADPKIDPETEVRAGKSWTTDKYRCGGVGGNDLKLQVVS